MRERNKLASGVEGVVALERELKDTIELAEMAEAEGDEAMLDEAVASGRPR